MLSLSLTSLYSHLYLGYLLIVLRVVLCDETHVSIHNLTPYKFTLLSSVFEDTTEDNVWDFPGSIKSGTAEEGHVNYAFSITGSAAETASVTYSVDSEDGSTKNGTFDIWLDVGDSLDENPTLRAQLHGFGAGRISDGQTFGPGFESEDEQRTPFILAGGQPGTELPTTYPNSA